MSLETINLIKDENIAVIKLNRPDLLNAVNEQQSQSDSKVCSILDPDCEACQ